ncbi:MAG: hypothetical protein RR205_01230 [Oscillospiraceae bacterium]
MLCLLPGIAAFVLFYLYEIYTVTGRFIILKPTFFIGLVLIFFSTCAASAAALTTASIVLWRVIIFGVLALICLALMFYSLFFAVPFSKTYIETTEKQPKKACRTGMYALCRHPGVLWFMGFYLFLWLSIGGTLLFTQFIFFSILNLIYIIIQDNWSFIICFNDYNDYKKEVPFLIPTAKSLQHCLETFHSSKGGRVT